MNEPSRSFEDLLVWQKSHQLVLAVYRYTENFPNYEMFGLTSQFRRAVVSIAANIAEGYKKKGKRDKIRFMNIAQGSLEECRYYLKLSNDLNYGKNDAIRDLLVETSKLLDSYMKGIQKIMK